MVVIHIKKTEPDQFLYETTCNESNDNLIKNLVLIWNNRLRIRSLVSNVRNLAKYGIMKPLDQQGIDEIKEEMEDAKIDKGEYYEADPTGIRTGNGVAPQLTETLERVCRDAELYIDKDQVRNRVCLTNTLIQEKIDNIRGAVTMAYPMGLPEWDNVKLLIDDVNALETMGLGQELLDPNTADLWLAGRKFERGQTISDRLGHSNEKTKIKAKLQAPNAGAPAREPGISEDERKAMMAFYFKKQEEMKRLAEANEDDYLNSPWADSKGMQKTLQGTSSIRAPGIR